MPNDLFIKYRRISFILLAAVVVTCPVFYFFIDLPVAKFVQANLPDSVKLFTQHITNAGDWFLCIFAVVALTARLVFKNKLVFRRFLFPLLTAAVAGIITSALKGILGRWRPGEYFQENGVYGFAPFSNSHGSWPSGHSSAIMATMTAIAIFFPKWRIPCFVVAALIGSTRIILSSHYLGDVFAGLILGYLCAHWLYYLLVRYKQLPEQKTRDI
jgi:membrane-associated phospholipid phosphatase